MKIDTSNWKEFKIGELFDIQSTKTTSLEDLKESGIGDFPYITTQATNNGVAGYYKIATEEGNVLTIDSAVAGQCFYQQKAFSASDHVEKLVPKFEMNLKQGLFLQTIINLDKYKYSYGRKRSQKVIRNEIIKLPATPDGQPDWEYIENFVGGLHSKAITTSVKSSKISLETEKWSEYRLGDIFDIQKGKRLISEDQTDGNTPYVGAIDSNNGIANWIGQRAIHEGNTISLSYNGSVGEAFYQPEPFWATDDVNVLYLKKKTLNPYIAMFICTILKQEKYRFSYGRKWTLDNMNNSNIVLPTKDNNPDWEWMENYIKSLPYSDKIL